MKEYEVCTEYINPCGGAEYAIREIFEVETDDPVEYVRKFLEKSQVELSVDEKAGGAITVYAVAAGMTQKFIFTPIE